MQFVPWQFISQWRCTACGKCCRQYSVVLKFPEWLSIVKNFGVENTVAGLDKLYIKRKSDGSCMFLYSYGNAYLCGLQHMKPAACKIWPFKVLTEPKFGQANRAAYDYHGMRLYVYADSNCAGLRYGTPSWEFTLSTLPEFVEIAMGKRHVQHKTTCSLSLNTFYSANHFSPF
jgi:Fe-S-cluster containining protein